MKFRYAMCRIFPYTFLCLLYGKPTFLSLSKPFMPFLETLDVDNAIFDFFFVHTTKSCPGIEPSLSPGKITHLD